MPSLGQAVTASNKPISEYSRKRGDYYGKTEQAFHGVQNGKPFTHIVRRRTKCLDCGQTRIDRTYENRPKE